MSLFHKPLVPVIKTLEFLLFQFQLNSESSFFWVKASKRTCAFHEIIGQELAEGYLMLIRSF
jgi:hypothetical protein